MNSEKLSISHTTNILPSIYMFRRRYRGDIVRSFVTNISKRELRYSFQSASVQKIHPTRTLSQGTDRLFLTPNLIALADHGQIGGPNQHPYLDDGFSTKLLKIIKYFYYKDQEQYHKDLLKLVEEAVAKNRQPGSCTLTLASMHPQTGDVNFYYVGDSVYGIFRDQNVQIVQGLYAGGFNKAIRVSNHEQSSPQYSPGVGYMESYPKQEIKNEDIIVIGSNGLWNNLDLNAIHYYVRGPGSFLEDKSKYQDAVGRKNIKDPRSLKDMADLIGNLASVCSKRGNYQSPLFLRAQKQGVPYPKEGLLDDVAVVVARRKKELVIKRSNQQSSEQVMGSG